MPRSRRRAQLIAVAAVAALALLAGCGGADDSEPKGDGPSTSDEAVDFAELSGQEITDLARGAMLDLEALAYAGEFPSNGEQIVPDVRASLDGRCTGTVG